MYHEGLFNNNKKRSVPMRKIGEGVIMKLIVFIKNQKTPVFLYNVEYFNIVGNKLEWMDKDFHFNTILNVIGAQVSKED